MSAHGAGKTLTVDVDGYQIDIDLDTKSPKKNQTIRFDFALSDLGNSGFSTDFDYVWVRIQSGQKIIFAGGIGEPVFGPFGFSTVLPESGAYVISLRFQNGEEKVVSGTANFDVGEGVNKQKDSFLGFLFTTQFFLGGLLGLILGFLGALMIKKK